MTKTMWPAIAFALLAVMNARSQDIIEQVRRNYNPQTVIEADIVLTIDWKVREKQEQKQGHITLAPGDRFRVELDNTIWVCNGQTFWQYNSATGQVIIKRLLDVDLSSHPSQLFETYLRTYRYEVAQQDADRAVLAWKADSSSAGSFYTSITLSVDRKKTILQSIAVVDRNGNASTYEFRKTRLGGDVQKSRFEFETPKGAHVLDTRN